MSTYVISGAASGIGQATKALLEERGHRVIGVDLRGADVTADLSTPAGRDQAVEGVRRLTDRVDGVVPCAGIAGLTGVDQRLLVSVNYFGAIALLEGLKVMMANPSAVVLLSSNSATCQPGWHTAVAAACLAGDEERARELAAQQDAVQSYPATKAALAGWARTVGLGWVPNGIRVNAIAPGLIATPMTEQLRADPELGVFADAYPTALNRPGRPEEIARLIAFLLSEESSLLVGSVVFADGGTDAMMNPTFP